jgi:hypothetical protein
MIGVPFRRVATDTAALPPTDGDLAIGGGFGEGDEAGGRRI